MTMLFADMWDELKDWLAQERAAQDGTSDPAWNAYESVLQKIADLETENG